MNQSTRAARSARTSVIMSTIDQRIKDNDRFGLTFTIKGDRECLIHGRKLAGVHTYYISGTRMHDRQAARDWLATWVKV